MTYNFDSRIDYGLWCRTDGKNLDFITLTGPFDDLPVVVKVRGKFEYSRGTQGEGAA